MLSLTVFAPSAAALVLLLWRGLPDSAVRRVWAAVSAVELGLVVWLWVTHDGTGIGHETRRRWIPGAGVGYHVGVDGLSLPLLALTAVVFLACAVYTLRPSRDGPGHGTGERSGGPAGPETTGPETAGTETAGTETAGPETTGTETTGPGADGGSAGLRRFVALFLALETACLGLFAALDLILFFVFFDLSLVGMYFVIAGCGHGERAARSALKFFLYTFLGSLALLLGFIGLFAGSAPHTFDMVELTRDPPLRGEGTAGVLVLVALAVGLAVKTPVFPFHTWLPPAHTDAPAAGSAVLAAVLLKMGTYGFVRIAMPMLPEAWRTLAPVFVAVGVVSALYGALVALAQRDFKRMVAYTSVNHMGYVLLAVGAAGMLSGGDARARSVAVSGAVVQMVSHGLITAALFLLAGVLWERGGSYRMDEWGGLAGPAPRFAAFTALAAFASLGLPGFSGFIAEFQIFAGSLGPAPVGTALALLGILVTAGLFLSALHRLFLGPGRVPRAAPATGAAVVADLRPAETWSVVPLLGGALALGVFPRLLLDTVEPAARTAVELVGR